MKRLFGRGNGGEEKLTKEEKEIQKFMEKYQLEDLDEKDLVILRRIATDIAGSELAKTGMALSLSSSEERLKIGYLSALVEQNWVIIRQLGRLNKNIEKINIED